MVLAPAAIRDSVQEFEPKARIAAQGFFAVSSRGVYLPQSGSRERDRQLRDWDRLDTLWAWKGARTGLLKRLAGVPWELTGDDAMQVLVDGNLINAIEHFQSVLQDAHFGQGWTFLVKRFGRDYYAQDFGALFEIIGPGDPDKAIEGAATGIAVLDSLRCFATGNPVWPILYFSHITNKMHRMHYTRVARFVDTPDGDERLYGSGECALSRYISVAQQEHLMGRYIESRLDDKAQPGVGVWTNISPDQREKAFATLDREQRNDEQPAWGRTAHLHSIDPTHPAKFESIPFAVAPEKFDYNQYTDIHINALALALGVDKQELWELSGGTLGSGQQSKILAQKSRGKAFGDFLTMIERFVNLYLLPDGLDFAFKYKDEEESKAQAEQDKAYIEIAEGMKRLSIPSENVYQMLADKSETFREVLTDESGQIIATEQEGLQPQVPDVTVTDDRTAQQGQTATTAQPAAPAPMRKVYSFTKAQFVQDWTDLILSGLGDELTRRNFGSSARAQLYRWGKAAFADGLQAGGVEGEMDEFDLKQVQDWLYDQSGYVTHFANELYKEGLPEDQIRARAELWANKSLDLIYNEGLISADKNGLYKWELGQTEQHCETCKKLNGQVHRLKEWYKRDLLPRSDKLDCGGWNCDCQLKRTTGRASGTFKRFDPSQPRDGEGQWTETGVGGDSISRLLNQMTPDQRARLAASLGQSPASLPREDPKPKSDYKPAAPRTPTQRQWESRIDADPEVHEAIEKSTGKSVYDFVSASGGDHIPADKFKKVRVRTGIEFHENGKPRVVTVSIGERGGKVDMERHFHYDKSGKPDHIYNAHFYLPKSEQGSGLGTKIFKSQTDQAGKMGFKSIVTSAGKSKTMNGYYTWPRLGYDATVNVSGKKTRLSDLMRTKEGRDYWKANGTSMEMEFDLSPKSRSRKILDAYTKERFGAK